MNIEISQGTLPGSAAVHPVSEVCLQEAVAFDIGCAVKIINKS